MSPNPYAPPQAVVADEPEPVMPRPRSVTVAVWMLWIEMALSTGSVALEMLSARETLEFMSLLILAVLVQGLSALLIYKIWRGRNWARITYLVLTLLGLLSMVRTAIVPADGARYLPSVETLLTFGEFTLDLVAMYLVFVPGRAWFRRR